MNPHKQINILKEALRRIAAGHPEPHRIAVDAIAETSDAEDSIRLATYTITFGHRDAILIMKGAS